MKIRFYRKLKVKTRIDTKRNTIFKKQPKIDPITDKIAETQLRWFEPCLLEECTKLERQAGQREEDPEEYVIKEEAES